MTLQLEQSGGVDFKLGVAPPVEHHDKGLQNRLMLSYVCDTSDWC